MTNSNSVHSKHEPIEVPDHGAAALSARLDPRMVAALPDPGLWSQMPREIVTYLIRNCSQSPWFNHLALASVIYVSSRVADPGHCVQNVHRFLRWAIPEHFPDLAHLRLEPALKAYFGDPSKGAGLNLFKSYHALQLHVERFLASLSPEQRVALMPFLLPSLTSSPALTRLASRASEKSQRARKAKAFAVVKHLPDLVGLARRRYRWLSDLDDQLQQVEAAVQSGDLNLPMEITCPSPEGAEKLHFRAWNRASWTAAHDEVYSPKALPRTDSPQAPEPLFLQCVGELPENPWFLNAVAQGALHGPSSLSADARQYLAKWGVGKLDPGVAGLLTTNRVMTPVLQVARHTAAGTPEDSRIVFCVGPLLAAAAVGLFVVVSVVSTGMRIGELQQVTLDRDCMEMLDLPAYDDQSGKWIPGPSHLYWRLYPKGRSQRERYLVTSQMNEAMFILLDLHKRFYGEHSLRTVRCSVFPQFTHGRRFPGKHRFVLQWSGRHLSHQSLTRCVQFLLLEHVCRDDQNHPVPITVHLLRHGVAGWLRQKGFPLEEIMLLLKQVNITVTDYYAQLSPDHLHQKLGPALTALAELAGTDPALIRSAEDIRCVAQEALLRYGALRRTPGGYCGTFDPCMVHFTCATCRFYVPDPRRRAEVAAKLILSEQIMNLRREAGDHLEADDERVHHREWERILKEMDAMEQVPLVAPSCETVLQNLADSDLKDLLLPRPSEHLTLLSGEKSSHDQVNLNEPGPLPGRLPSAQSGQVSADRSTDAPGDREIER